MCANTEPEGKDQYPNRWQQQFETLSEIYAFAYGQLTALIEQAQHDAKPREYLRDMYTRHQRQYRDTLSHYFTEISHAKRREIRAGYRAAREFNDSNG